MYGVQRVDRRAVKVVRQKCRRVFYFISFTLSHKTITYLRVRKTFFSLTQKVEKSPCKANLNNDLEIVFIFM